MAVTGARALVTGGGGFIGAHLVERLLREGFSVRVLDNFATGDRENLVPVLDEIELVEGDIQSYERVHTAVKGCEVVFHLAALPSVPRSVQDPLTSNASNVTGTLNVLLTARDEEVRRVVLASSSSVYGANPDLPKREDMPTIPIAPYAVSKLAAENYGRSFYNVYGLETVALRYFNIFGPRQDPLSQYAAVIPRFITAVLDGGQPLIHGDGDQSRDFTYIDNAVEANVLAAAAPDVAGETFNIACGDRISLNDLIGELEAITGEQITPLHDEGRPGDVRHSLADISRAREKLGYEPAVDLRTGVQLTYDYHAERHVGERPLSPR
jgi:nucleoside-diphosphate-sugar epimerase